MSGNLCPDMPSLLPLTQLTSEKTSLFLLYCQDGNHGRGGRAQHQTLLPAWYWSQARSIAGPQEGLKKSKTPGPAPSPQLLSPPSPCPPNTHTPAPSKVWVVKCPAGDRHILLNPHTALNPFGFQAFQIESTLSNCLFWENNFNEGLYWIT